MNNFTFYNPTIIHFGKGANSKIADEIAKRGLKKILLLAGGGSIKLNGVYIETIESLKQNDIEWSECWGVRANPSVEHARKAMEIIKNKNIEAILAVGGGSVIDEAKALSAGFYFDDVWTPYENHTPIQKALPIFTILTISATGSEMDGAAVLSNDELKKKWAIYGAPLFPTASAIDPSAQATLPWNQTVNGAIDALSHIMEFYFVGANEEATISINEALMKTIIKAVDELKANPENYNSRANLAWCATLALNGISGAALRGGDWSSHRLEHALSAMKVETAHGAGLAVIFPAWIDYVKNFNPSQFSRWARTIWDSDTPEEAIRRMRAKYKNWGAPISLKELGFTDNDIKPLAQNAKSSGDFGALKKMEIEDLEAIYRLAL